MRAFTRLHMLNKKLGPNISGRDIVQHANFSSSTKISSSRKKLSQFTAALFIRHHRLMKFFFGIQYGINGLSKATSVECFIQVLLDVRIYISSINVLGKLFEAQKINRNSIICTNVSINIEPDLPVKSYSNDTTNVHEKQFSDGFVYTRN